jgi:hypothetical protein
MDLLTENFSDEIAQGLDSMDVEPGEGSFTPSEQEEQSSYEKQKASLQTYLDSLPFPCESIGEMHAALETIVGKIAICVKTHSWHVLSTWDQLLLSCVDLPIVC